MIPQLLTDPPSPHKGMVIWDSLFPLRVSSDALVYSRRRQGEGISADNDDVIYDAIPVI